MKIIEIETESLAEEIGLAVGDRILKINQQTPHDLIDLSFQMAEEYVEILVGLLKKPEERRRLGERNFEKSKGFSTGILQEKRTAFYEKLRAIGYSELEDGNKKKKL